MSSQQLLADADGARSGPSGLSPALSVLLTVHGLGVPRLIPAAPWEVAPMLRFPLDLAGLRDLAGLARDGVTSDHLVEPVSPLVEALRLFGLLGDGAPVVPTRMATPEPPELGGAPDPSQELTLWSPMSFAVGADGHFRACDHSGSVVADLTADELWWIREFVLPRTAADVREALIEELPDMDPGFFDAVVARVISTGLLGPADTSIDRTTNSDHDDMVQAIRGDLAVRQRSKAVNAEHDRVVRAQAEATGYHPARVVAVQVAGNIPPLSTGMVLAHAMSHLPPESAESYDLHPRWVTDIDDIVVESDVQTIYLFTSYIWSHERNLDFAAAVKDRQPDALTVFGGPDCPAGAADVASYMEKNPQVDIAVRGEGEVTFTEALAALAPSMRSGAPDLSALHAVMGLTYRVGGEVVRTGDRDRMEDLNVVPSPYSMGVFDVFGHTRQIGMAIIETNRGCPYGCTFCDWGSSTRSRIRQFDLDRVFEELEWCAANAVPKIFMADANFGIFARDVGIARHVAALKAEYGYPKQFITNYAKNTVKHLSEIVAVLAEGGVISEGLLSLQSMDTETLTAIRRSNIKLEKYEALAREFHSSRMPLFVDLMMGLPGQTVESLRADFQQCIDREVMAKCHATELLVNSPMNQPEYRSEFKIEVTRPAGPTGVGAKKAERIGPAFVVASSSFTRDDYNQMHRMRRAYLLAENFGVLRQVMRFVRRETGMDEIVLVESMRKSVEEDPGARPALAMALLSVPDSMVPPTSWEWFIDEVGQYLVSEVGLAPGSDLDTVLAVQHAVLPASGRSFPFRLDLEHDYAAWLAAALKAKDEGHLHDWETVVPRLADFGPTEFEVTDPFRLCEKALGRGSVIQGYLDWELASPIARAVPAHYRMK